MPLRSRPLHALARSAALSAVLLLPAACATVSSTASAPAATSLGSADSVQGGWYRDVAALAAAEDNARRRGYLRTRLQAMGLAVRSGTFEAKDKVGENLFADVSGEADAPLLLIGAHTDRVSVGRGATDNASGTAVALALAERFHRQPLQRHRVKIALWDLEEAGLLGSRAYVATGDERPALYVNFDVFGWGDSLWLMTPDNAPSLRSHSETAARAHGLAITSGEEYPPTDHRAFLDAGWPAVSYSLVGGEEIPGILALFAGQRPATTPKVMEVIHSRRDTIEQVDAQAAAKGIDAVEAALRAWDAATAE